MMKHFMLIICFVVSGCTWVQLSDAGSNVQVRETANSSCELKGSTTAVSRASLAGIDRNPGKFKTELETLARNEAVSLDGNVVVADGPPNGNQQSFKVYRCP